MIFILDSGLFSFDTQELVRGVRDVLRSDWKEKETRMCNWQFTVCFLP